MILTHIIHQIHYSIVVVWSPRAVHKMINNTFEFKKEDSETEQVILVKIIFNKEQPIVIRRQFHFRESVFLMVV